MTLGISYVIRSFALKMEKATHSSIPIIDLRSSDLFNKSHISSSSNFPVAELPERLHELPACTQPISLFGSPLEIQTAMNFLVPKRYIISNRQIASDEELQQLEKLNRLSSGDTYQRLWNPAKIVSQFVDNFSDKCENKNGLDLACGSGRDSVYMAMHGWTMTGVDYLPSALQKMSDLTKRCKQSVNTVLMDLEKSDLDDGFCKLRTINQFYGCVIVVRYLHRSNLHLLKQLIDVSGFIVYQTFMQGCEKFGRPKNPKFLLRKGELAETFSDFDILVDEIEYLDDGRPTNCFIAQKVE